MTTTPFTRPDGFNPDPWVFLYLASIVSLIAVGCAVFVWWRRRKR